MTKDVTNSTLTEIKVDFKTAVINIDREAIETQVEAAVEQYSKQEVTVENYDAVYSERTAYNKLIEGLEDKRKELRRKSLKPYDDFNNWYEQKVKNPLEKVVEEMSLGINSINEHKKKLRLDVVRAVFEEKCMVAGLEKSTFESKYADYAKATLFKNGKMELKKATLEEMDALVLAEFDALEQYKANKQAIYDQAQDYDLLPDSYIRHLEDGKSLVDVLQIMKSDRDQKELRKQQQEAREKAEAERQAEIERMAQEEANATIKAYNAETGEIIENEPLESDEGINVPPAPQTSPEVPKFEPSEPVSYDLRLTFPLGNPQAKQFKEWLEANGVTFETLLQGKTMAELTGGTADVF
ncbi:DUF1351 domain-containing protein [Streptococcus hyointestinalis]|nr:DUF1351 domain-containing protein [Streptococcus hyointestinalis]